MDAELKAFLEKIASSLDSRLDGLRSEMVRLRAEFRTEILEAEARLNARIDNVGRLGLDANRTLRTRD